MFVAAALAIHAFPPGERHSSPPGDDRHGAQPVIPNPPAWAPAPPASLPSQQRAALVAEAERAISARLGGARTARFGHAIVADVRQRIVCGEVVPLGSGGAMSWKRYVSFGGTGIALVDDGSTDFAEIHLSACTPAGSREGRDSER